MDQGILVVDHPSTNEDVSTLEIPYNQVPPLLIPYDFSQMTNSNNPISPMVITVPTSFPFNDTKVVPWIYNSIVYIHGQSVQDEPTTYIEPIANITGVSGVTRSERIFAHIPQMTDNGGPSNQEKVKQAENDQQRQDSLPTSKVEEFLRIIKKSDYRVVDQLYQTPSKIPMLSLLMCSEAHRVALVEFLKVSHVP